MRSLSISAFACSALLSLNALAADADSQQHAAEQADPSLHCPAATTQAITDASTRMVLKALVDPLQASDRTSLFEQYLATPVASPNSARQVASSHARVVLAAEHIRAGRHEQARQVLAQVDLASTVAVDAALLMAESWRLQGDDRQSQAWLVRVAQRYSSDPRALEGLLLSARDLAASGKVREAWALYNLINDKVLANVEQVSTMRSMQEELVQQLLNTRLDESRAVSTQVIKEILHAEEQSALSSMRDIIEARQQLACLERQGDALKDDAWDESIMTANVTSFQTMLETEARLNARQLEALQAELASASALEKGQIEEEIASLQEHMQSAERRLAELQAQQAALPVSSVSRTRQLQQKISATEQRLHNNQVAIRSELDHAIAALQTRYRELAAETQLARAELMQLLAVNQ